MPLWVQRAARRLPSARLLGSPPEELLHERSQLLGWLESLRSKPLAACGTGPRPRRGGPALRRSSSPTRGRPRSDVPGEPSIHAIEGADEIARCRESLREEQQGLTYSFLRTHEPPDQPLGFRIRFDTELLVESRLELAISSQGRRTPTKRRLNGHGPSDEVLAHGVGLDRAVEDRDGLFVLPGTGQQVGQPAARSCEQVSEPFPDSF